MNVEVLTAERRVYSAKNVDIVLAPSQGGQLGIMPGHVPLLTTLDFGDLIIRVGDEEQHIAVGGGFMEVRGGMVSVLADTAERAEEIDVAKAEEARRRAEELIKQRKKSAIDFATAEANLRRSLIQLKVAETRRRKGGRRADVKRPEVRETE